MRASVKESAAIRPTFRKTELASAVGAILSVGTLAVISPSAVVAQEADPSVLEEIIVTASRREQGINEIPASITALSGQQLERMGANGLEDYFTAIPSLSLVDRGPGRNNIIIRGVTNDSSLFYGDPQTSALYFDEVPVSEGTYPDLHTFDVQRIEVLRGPQGTLYGAGSLGGAVRIITEKPDPARFAAKLDTTVEGISGHGVGTRLNLMLNTPLIEDVLAARVVGYSHDIPGFYENANEFRPDDDASTEKLNGGRLAVRWLPTENLTIDARAIVQSQEADGYPAEQDALPLAHLDKFQHDFGSGGKLDDDVKVYSLDAELDMDFGTLIAATSYLDRDRIFIENVNRYTYYYGYDSETQDYINPGFGPNEDIFLPVSSLVTDDHYAWSGELRLVSTIAGPLSYSVGAFYSETTTNHGVLDYTDPAGEVHLSVLDEAACTFLGDDPCESPYDMNTVLFDDADFGDFDDTLRNISIYGEIDYALNSWTVTAGLRAFDLHMESEDPVLEDYDEDGVSPKLGIQYDLNESNMFYALYSEGFRRGNYPGSLIRADQEQELAARLGGRLPGEYTTADQPIIDEVLLDDDNLCGAAYPNFGRQTIESDSLKNYEIGARTTLLDGRLQLNTTVYQVDWENLQVLQVIDCGSGAGFFDTANGNQGDARIRGVEVDWSLRATDRLYLNLSAGYTHSRLQEDANLFPPGNPFTLTGVFEEPLGRRGNRSPAVPELMVSLSGTYSFPVPFIGNSAYEGFLHFSYDYQGDSFTEYTQRPEERSGDYGLVDLRLGVGGDRWEVSAFVKNVTDDDSRTYVDVIPLTRGNNITRVQPRTIGMNFAWSFGD